MVAKAPPHALGALAGGTDAAPRPDRIPGVEAMPEEAFPGLPTPVPPAAPGSGGSTGDLDPAPDSGPALPEPDAGMAL
jgi:hypothetical protein